MDKFLKLLIFWLQLDCKLEGSGNGQRKGRPQGISPPGKTEKARELYLLGVSVEIKKLNLKELPKNNQPLTSPSVCMFSF